MFTSRSTTIFRDFAALSKKRVLGFVSVRMEGMIRPMPRFPIRSGEFLMIAKRPFRGRVPRRGVVIVELAFILPLLLFLIIGVWEVGRLVYVQQIMHHAARDAARLASQANIINTTGQYTRISKSTGTPNLDETVRDYVQGSGITNITGLTVQFQYLDGDTTLTQPYQGVKNQKFRVRVTLPYANVRWTGLNLVNPSTVGGECIWMMMVDDPFTVNSTLPGWTP
jgi:Flp pilus assembly protein TadG